MLRINYVKYFASNKGDTAVDLLNIAEVGHFKFRHSKIYYDMLSVQICKKDSFRSILDLFDVTKGQKSPKPLQKIKF